MNILKGIFIAFIIFISIRRFFLRWADSRTWNVSSAGKQSVLQLPSKLFQRSLCSLHLISKYWPTYFL